MKINDLQKELADALNGVEELVQRGCKAFAEALKGKPLTVDQTWRDAKRRDGTTHLAHFLPDPTRSDNIPMTVGDVELLPSVWREPDRVRKLRKDLFEAQLDTIDGHTIVAQIKMLDTKNGYMPQLWTLYKKSPVLAPSPEADCEVGPIVEKDPKPGTLE